ncbi:hypothetical protein [Aquimarina macrocephali]|uniref:hypothetical protein n=1 Tax=Aquimarina macrocephali TaxID=666563 RepID=UPI003F675656
MSDKLEVFEDGKVYTDFNSRVDWEKCKSFLGVKFCIRVSVTPSGGIKLCASIAGYEKCFAISGNGCFSFQPISIAKLKVCISDWSIEGGRICFRIKVEICVKVPIWGWKCVTLVNTKICIPIPAKGGLQLDSHSEQDQLLHLQLLSSGDLENKDCDCDD